MSIVCRLGILRLLLEAIGWPVLLKVLTACLLRIVVSDFFVSSSFSLFEELTPSPKPDDAVSTSM